MGEKGLKRVKYGRCIESRVPFKSMGLRDKSGVVEALLKNVSETIKRHGEAMRMLRDVIPLGGGACLPRTHFPGFPELKSRVVKRGGKRVYTIGWEMEGWEEV